MAVRIVEVHTPPAGVAVDLARVLFERIGPEVEPTCLDAPEDYIEVLFVDQKRVVLGYDIGVARVDEIERRAVVELDDQKMTEGAGCPQAQNAGKESSGGRLVAAVNDRVVETDTHVRTYFGDKRFREVGMSIQCSAPPVSCWKSRASYMTFTSWYLQMTPRQGPTPAVDLTVATASQNTTDNHGNSPHGFNTVGITFNRGVPITGGPE